MKIEPAYVAFGVIILIVVAIFTAAIINPPTIDVSPIPYVPYGQY